MTDKSYIWGKMGILFQFYEHSGAEGILGEVVSPIQVSYLSKSVSTGGVHPLTHLLTHRGKV